MSAEGMHHDWLSLIEISGPFLAVPVLKEAFPQGLEELDGVKRKRLRQAYEEWREALETDDPQLPELHAAWVDEVLSRGLELDEDGRTGVLKRADWCTANLSVSLSEHAVTLAPDLAVVDEQRANKPLMLIHTYAQDTDLDATQRLDGWAATSAERMVQLCRATGCRLALVTNGERWMLIDAPVGAVTTFASWYARIWAQAPITLQAFVHLLGIRRFFVDEAEQLPALFDRSLKYQDEVTEALGEQVRRAVEVLIQALDKADQDRDRNLLRDVKEPELYEAALTLMMRLVFLLAAEERGLLLLGDERYESNYAISTLRMQLRAESEEILDRRWDAWSRLLATFRAVFGGIEHENLRLPALGGSLFDPDRFPFLEGRTKGSNWRTEPAKPLPIDNRTVLLLLEAIQQFQGRTLSYRALDVEQVGYVYEGLLERTVKRTAEVTLELDGTKNAKAPLIRLAELESPGLEGARLVELLQDRSGSSVSRIRNDLAKPVDDTLADRLLAACHGDFGLRDRIKRFAHLVRSDPWGYPLVYPAGAFIVTTGSDRRETGTHYTPKSLTEAIVVETLTPVVYVGPSEGWPRDQWALKSPSEILELKICDPAMGSGAFLVQACRWLAERLVEAWSETEKNGGVVSVDGEVLDAATGKELLPRDTEARTLIARRLIAERCLYGVDLNPLAVELAKLSIWLVTLAKGRPFGFLDHNLRCGDSLLGIHRLDQLTELSMMPTGKGQQRLFGQNIERAVLEAIELRHQLRRMPIRDIQDVDAAARLDADARRKLEVPGRIADAFIGEVFAFGGSDAALENAIASLAICGEQAVEGDRESIASIARRASTALATDLPAGKSKRKPFHWPLEFPEVFRIKAGFDALLGNPPFLGGRRQRAVLGSQYQSYIANVIGGGGSINADLCAFFFRRAGVLVAPRGTFGLIASNSLGQGATREMGLDPLCRNGFSIYRAISNFEWPGEAGVTVAVVWMRAGNWIGNIVLDGKGVSRISSYLSSANSGEWTPVELAENAMKAFQGSNVLGTGFVISEETATNLIKHDPKNASVIQPFIRGEDFNSTPDQRPLKWIINFFDWPLVRSGETNNTKPVAEDFPQCLDIVERLVKTKRQQAKRKAYRERWWQYAERCGSLYAKVKGLNRVIFQASPSKHICFGFAIQDAVYSGPHTVVASDAIEDLAVLQSSIHTEWAWQFCSTMRNSGIRYNPSDFRKFPRPKHISASQEICADYYNLRQSIMLNRGYGLTSLYNDYHNPQVTSSDVSALREAQLQIDRMIADAYGWQDLTISLDFRSTNQGTRYSLSSRHTEEVLRRLVELNKSRYEEEASEEIEGKLSRKGKSQSQVTETVGQRGLNFDASMEPTSTGIGADSAAIIIAYLLTQPGWLAKSDILTATGLLDGQWNISINALISDGKVERHGEKRGTRYRAVSGAGEQ